jgi:hypothetical protein
LRTERRDRFARRQQQSDEDVYEGKLIKGHSRQVYLIHHQQKLPVYFVNIFLNQYCLIFFPLFI